jgi:hypothetical protein
MTARIPLTFGLFLLLAGVCIGQEKAESDICNEFLKNSVAGVVILRPLIVREVKGAVLVPYSRSATMVFFENKENSGKISKGLLGKGTQMPSPSPDPFSC